jgi:hypothetical protein
VDYYFLNKKHEDAFQLDKVLDAKLFQNENLCSKCYSKSVDCISNAIDFFARQFFNNKYINFYQQDEEEKEI